MVALHGHSDNHATRPSAGCQWSVFTMFHEMGHICGPGCNSHDDDGPSQTDLNEYAKCVRDCLLLLPS